MKGRGLSGDGRGDYIEEVNEESYHTPSQPPAYTPIDVENKSDWVVPTTQLAVGDVVERSPPRSLVEFSMFEYMDARGANTVHRRSKLEISTRLSSAECAQQLCQQTIERS